MTNELSVDSDGPQLLSADPELLEFSTALVGTLNHEEIHLLGSGIIDERSGFTEGRYEVHKLPGDVDPRSLGAFLLTGYPNACRTSETDVDNPFSGGGYTYKRHYSFSRSRKEALLEVHCDLSADQRSLKSVFTLSGGIPSFGGVQGVAPIYELWSPSADIIDGVFNVAWLSDGQDAVIEIATAHSSYEPVQAELLRGKPKHRFIKLESEIDDSGCLALRQHSNLANAHSEA
jgi:hypothetical protein